MLKFYLNQPFFRPNRHAVFLYGLLRFGGLAKPCVKKKSRCYHYQQRQHQYQLGFTLLEMLVVIALIGIVALGTTTLLIDDGESKRQDETIKRWDAIRKAIIGEPNLSLNGSPYVAGYVADMGRLPLSISELIERDVSFDSDGDFIDDTPCGFDHDNNAVTPNINIQQPDFTEVQIANYIPSADFTNTVSGGWREPYLYTAGSSFYGDGWFNQNTGDACDFDWNIITTPVNLANLTDITDLRIQSLGSDRNIGGADTAQDYPSNNLNMINESEWTLGLAPITFNVQFNRAVQAADIPAAPNPLQLKIYRYVDDGNAIADAADLDEIIADSTFILTNGSALAPSQTVSLTGLPVGRFAAVVWCTGNNNILPPPPPTDPSYANDVVYDGNCIADEDSNGTDDIKHSPVYFTLTNSTTQATITWNLP